MGAATPAVSVIVPCFNLGAYLDEAVESVLSQTFRDFEIIVVNDGSTDPETNRLLTTYRKPRTRVVHTDNRGLPAARNLAIEHAAGRYLCALDADDKLAPTFLEKTVRLLNDRAELTFVSCCLETFGTENWTWRQDRCDLETLLFECTVATPALVRKQAVVDVGGYDPAMRSGYEDWDLWISLVERGYTGTIVPEVLFYYRRRPGSMSDTCCHGEAHLDLFRYMVRKHEASYRAHLLDLLIRKEAVSADLLRTAYQTEREIGSRLEPTVQRRQDELARLQRRLDSLGQHQGASDRIAELAHALEAARRDNASLAAAASKATTLAAALHQSLSWRLTMPLRVGYELLRRFSPTLSRQRTSSSDGTPLAPTGSDTTR